MILVWNDCKIGLYHKRRYDAGQTREQDSEAPAYK